MSRFVSYGTNHEDVLLHRAFGDQPSGFYVDIGAYHPVDSSLTKALSDRGWVGINIEPNPGVAFEFAKFRPRDVNLAVAVGSKQGTLTFYEVPDGAQLSTLSVENAEACRRKGLAVIERRIEVTTLASVCKQHVGERPIDVLLIDTEGNELEVIRGADFARWRPSVIIIEATYPATNKPNHHSWEPLLTAVGYEFTLFDGINRVYVRADRPDLIPRLSYPVNFLDEYISSHAFEWQRAYAAYSSLGGPGRWTGHLVAACGKLVNRLTGRR